MAKNPNAGIKGKILQFEESMDDVTVMENKRLPVKPTSREPGMVKQRIRLFDNAINNETILQRSLSDEILAKANAESIRNNKSAKWNQGNASSGEARGTDESAVSFVHRSANKKRVRRKNAQRSKQKPAENIHSDSSVTSDRTIQPQDKKLPPSTFLYKTIQAPELPFDPADVDSERSETEADSSTKKLKPMTNQQNGRTPSQNETQQENGQNHQGAVVEEQLFTTRNYLRQLSKEELLQNFYLIEQLRSSYIKQIEEVIKCDNFEEQVEIADSPQSGQEHDIKIYRNELSPNDPLDEELGISLLPEGEQDYVVEAYNKPGSELVISDLKVDHQTSHLPNQASVEPNHRINRPCSNNSNNSSVFFDEENATVLEDLNLNDNCSGEDNEENSVYMSLSECMSELSLKSDKEYEYFGDVPMRIKPREVRQSPNLKIQIGVEVFHDNNQYKSRRKTLYDKDCNPRIEKVSLIPEKAGSSTAKSPTEKKEFIVEEIIQTEAVYVSNLEKVVKEYIPCLTQGNTTVEKCLFSNIRAIYEKSKEFFAVLKLCDYDHEKIAKTFIQFRRLFELYPIYSMNKSSCDRHLLQCRPLAKKKQEELGDRLDLASYMLTPVQRLGKYILFLQSITKELNKSGIHSVNVQTALDIVKRSMTRGNDLIAICSIKSCPINLVKEAGSFVMREKFQILKPKKLVSTVFLFEEIVVFTIDCQKEKEAFSYVDSIKMEDLTITTFEGEPFMFHLKNFPECKKGNAEQYTFVLQSKLQKVKEIWAEAIEKRLWEQLNKFKEQVSKTFSRNPSTSSNNSTERLKSSTSFRKTEQTGRKTKSRRRSTFYI